MPLRRRPRSLCSFAQGLTLSVAGVALVLVAGVAASWPLWYLATRHANLYLLLLLAGVAGLAARSAYRRKIKGSP